MTAETQLITRPAALTELRYREEDVSMYKIIGGDGREYGPVSSEQLRQWIAEGRADAQTRVQPAGSTEWRPLGNCTELAGAASPPVLGGSLAKPAGAEKKIVAGICGIVIGHLGVHKFILGYTGEGVIMLLVTVLTCGLGGIVMWIIGLIEGITYLSRSDEEFVATYITNRKGWF